MTTKYLLDKKRKEDGEQGSKSFIWVRAALLKQGSVEASAGVVLGGSGSHRGPPGSQLGHSPFFTSHTPKAGPLGLSLPMVGLRVYGQ